MGDVWRLGRRKIAWDDITPEVCGESAVSDGLSDDGTPRGTRTHNPRLKRIIPLLGNEKSIGMQCAEPSFGPVGECGEAVEKRCECPCVAPDYASRIVSFLVMRYLVTKAVEAAARKC